MITSLVAGSVIVTFAIIPSPAEKELPVSVAAFIQGKLENEARCGQSSAEQPQVGSRLNQVIERPYSKRG